MTKKPLPPIVQSVELPNSGEWLFWTYMSPMLHGRITGGKAAFTGRGKFSAFDGMLTGEFIHIEEGKLIIQTWRSSSWAKTDPDSILILRFRDSGKGKGTIDLFHENVPSHDYRGVKEGWNKFYWKPWKAYLAGAKAAATASKGSATKGSKKPAKRLRK